ncbi:MAG: hypothetical protein K0R00_134 [Herbinix sp.]|jgi:predicted DNA-binding transcriptional regulator YafY|nr:hypothetical protein [Herbinix sp.]
MADYSILQTISKSARDKKMVTIIYRSSGNDISERDTEPYEIKGDQYFGGTEKGIRCFKLDNILSARETDKDFVPRWPIKI